MKTFHFFSDSAHGWLRVTMSDLRASGAYDKISSYSYKSEKFVYLEEDCDASEFLEGYRHLIGEFQIKQHPPVETSSIRYMHPFRR